MINSNILAFQKKYSNIFNDVLILQLDGSVTKIAPLVYTNQIS